MKKQKIRKVVKVKPFDKEDFEREELEKPRRNDLIGVNFQKIENHPVSKQDHEIQRKITVEPKVLENLIQEEERAIALEAAENSGLSEIQKACIKLKLEGFTNAEVERELKINESSVRWYLQEALPKLMEYVRLKYPRR